MRLTDKTALISFPSRIFTRGEARYFLSYTVAASRILFFFCFCFSSVACVYGYTVVFARSIMSVCLTLFFCIISLLLVFCDILGFSRGCGALLFFVIASCIFAVRMHFFYRRYVIVETFIQFAFRHLFCYLLYYLHFRSLYILFHVHLREKLYYLSFACLQIAINIWFDKAPIYLNEV